MLSEELKRKHKSLAQIAMKFFNKICDRSIQGCAYGFKNLNINFGRESYN